MKKLLTFSLLSAALMLAACGGKETAATAPAEEVETTVTAEEAVFEEAAIEEVVADEVAGLAEAAEDEEAVE